MHRGTYGYHAEELVHYLKSIRPEKLILNGYIIDIWQFSKGYFPKNHICMTYPDSAELIVSTIIQNEMLNNPNIQEKRLMASLV